MSTRKMKKCTKCDREFSFKNISRHMKTCKGIIIKGKKKCEKCGKLFGSSNIKRHLSCCKGQKDEVDVLKDKLLKVLEDNKKLMEDNIKKGNQIRRLILLHWKERTHRIRLANKLPVYDRF